VRESIGDPHGLPGLPVTRRVRLSFSSGAMSYSPSSVDSQVSENAAFSALTSAIDQAIHSAESNPAVAQRTMLALYDEAVALGARRIAARALLHLARIARRTSSVDEAQRLAYRALDELRDLSDPEGESEAVSLIAGAWAMVGELIEARRMFELGIERARAENLPGSIGLLLAGLAFTYGAEDDAENYVRLTEQALEYLLPVGHKQRIANAWANLGGGLVKLPGRLDDAEAAYRKALEITQANDLDWLSGIALGGLGEVYALRGDWSQARAHFVEGAEQLLRSAAIFDVANQARLMAELLLSVGEAHDAALIALLWLDECESRKLHGSSARLLLVASKALRELGYMEQAWDTMHRAKIAAESAAAHDHQRLSARVEMLVRVRLSEHTEPEIKRLSGELDRARQALAHELEVRQSLVQLATTDPLTGLPNRRSLTLVGNAHLRSRYAAEFPITLLAMDLDFFKRINDLWGHAAGDAVLVAVADVLRAELPAWATVARIGGEEFVAVVPDLNLERGLELAERVRQRLSAVQVERPEGVIATTVSVGVVEAALDKSFEWSMELADRCCYRAKEMGRNRVCSVADLLEAFPG
jgi:diguanylate cyclase (GGDEF)-like protein